MARTRQLDLFVTDTTTTTPTETRAIFRLEQGLYRCFLIDPQSPSGDQGAGALALWTGDLGADTGEAKSSFIPPRLGGAAVWSEHHADNPVMIVDEKGKRATIGGALTAMNVVASQIGDENKTHWLKRESVSHALQQVDEHSHLTLLLEGE